MRRCRRALVAGATILLLTFAGVVTTAGSASAATCYGTSCHGLDPSITQCDQYYSTPNTTSFDGATLTNWYSTGCNANWALGYLSAADQNSGYSFQLYIYTTDSTGAYEFMCYPSTDSNSGFYNEPCDDGYYNGSVNAYTDMVDGTNVTYAQLDLYDGNGDYLGTLKAPQ